MDFFVGEGCGARHKFGGSGVCFLGGGVKERNLS